jgi:NADH pyrophosphatase NudC (nudix superfamily)
MFLAYSIALFAAVLVLVLWVRPSDIELGSPPNPTAHLEERKSAIYSNLRDLTFEYRLGKLSDSDYEKTKHGLQEELAKVMAEIDSPSIAAQPAAAARRAKASANQAKAAPTKTDQTKADPLVCPHCKARFDKPMRFCGECGKPMLEVNA